MVGGPQLHVVWSNVLNSVCAGWRLYELVGQDAGVFPERTRSVGREHGDASWLVWFTAAEDFPELVLVRHFFASLAVVLFSAGSDLPGILSALSAPHLPFSCLSRL